MHNQPEGPLDLSVELQRLGQLSMAGVRRCQRRQSLGIRHHRADQRPPLGVPCLRFFAPNLRTFQICHAV